MSIWQVIILAFIQGVTEFLPVSSSGHLVIFQKALGFTKPPVAFDVLLHLGSALAILFFLRKEIFKLLKDWQKNLNLFSLLVISSIPAGVVGILFKKELESTFNSLKILGISYLITAVLLFSTSFIKGRKEKRFGQITFSDSIIVGFFQAAAILPGVSRSGSTIIGSLWCNLSTETSFIFSFLLAIPAILGASLVEVPEMFHQDGQLGFGAIGMMISVFVSYIALVILEKVLKSKKLYLFGWYCLILAIYIIIQI